MSTSHNRDKLQVTLCRRAEPVRLNSHCPIMIRLHSWLTSGDRQSTFETHKPLTLRRSSLRLHLDLTFVLSTNARFRYKLASHRH
jgi:hypothetical protein